MTLCWAFVTQRSIFVRRLQVVAAVGAVAVMSVAGLVGCDPVAGTSSDSATGGSGAASTAGGGSGDSDGGSPAAKALDGLTVRPKGSMTGYDRLKFGPAWTDNNNDPGGHNHCDTRNDILARDLIGISYKSGHCTVATGTLQDPYTGKTIHFVRGPESTKVQIDHVVPLGDAWVTGAAQLTATQRLDLAEDPLELIAADGPANEAKGDDDASEWLPANASYQCRYVARQIAVKVKYGLWVTAAEKSAMQHVLGTCPDQNLPME
jgi:hypothetical protein